MAPFNSMHTTGTHTHGEGSERGSKRKNGDVRNAWKKAEKASEWRRKDKISDGIKRKFNPKLKAFLMWMNPRMREKNTFFPFISCFFYILHSFQLHRLTLSPRCCSRLSSWWKCLLISSLHFNIFIHFAYKLFHARSLPSPSKSLSWKCSKNETTLGSFPKHLSIWERVAWWSEFSPPLEKGNFKALHPSSTMSMRRGNS